MLDSPFLNAVSLFVVQNYDVLPTALLGGILAAAAAWVVLISKSLSSHFRTPSIQSAGRKNPVRPKRDWLALRRLRTIPLPLVSVIVPARNEEESIRECLISILLQRDANFEVIAIDDNSTDRTLAIMRELEAQTQFSGKLRVLSIDTKPDG